MHYTSAIIISCMSILCLTLLVHGNTHISKDAKRRFYRSYIIILIAVLSEWLSVMLDGTPWWTRSIHYFAKFLDYVFTPAAGIFFVRQILGRSKTDKVTVRILLLNLVFQFSSVFTGWTYFLDENNYMHHGPLWWVYMLVYLYSIAYVICCVVVFSRSFDRRNLIPLAFIIVIILVGAAIQELSGSTIRTASISMVMGSILLFIYYSDYSMLSYDEEINRQNSLLNTDALTGIYSRYAFYEALETYSIRKLPRNTAVFSFDINCLKKVNDTLGHVAGDELIKGAATIINSVFSPFGKCYRIGGDEMAAVIAVAPEKIPELVADMRMQCDTWIGEYSSELSIAVGYVRSELYPALVLEELYSKADTLMYEDKLRFHSSF